MRICRVICPLIVVMVATVFPRIMVIGGPPASDEGVYAYIAQIVHSNLAAGHGLPNTGWLALYSLLGSWVFGLSANHFILLRLMDLLVAAVASWLIYRIVEHESGSPISAVLISTVFLFTMNQPVFIQCGFKNSIFAAYLPLFFAFRLGQEAIIDSRTQWGMIGALVVFSVLLRETFIPFLIIGTIAIFVTYGWRSCMKFTFGAILAGLFIIIVIAVLRGGLLSIINAYRDAGVFFASVADTVVSHFITHGKIFAKEAIIALLMCGVGLASIFYGFMMNSNTVTVRRFIFWLAIALLPLIEPAIKRGFEYHFAVCLPGMAGLTALGWKSLRCAERTKIAITVTGMMLCMVFLFPKALALAHQRSASRVALRFMQTGFWPPEAIARSNYLLTAEAIRKIAPATATLSVSRMMLVLFPLTGMRSPTFETCSLNSVLYKVGSDEQKFKQALLASSPDVLATTTATDWPGEDIITKVVMDTGLYEAVAVIPKAPDKSYGFLGITVYRKINLIKVR